MRSLDAGAILSLMVVLGAGLPAARAQQTEVKWSEASSGGTELPLGASFDLDFGNVRQSEFDFQFEPWEGGYFWAPKRGCTVVIAGLTDYASFDIARADALSRGSERVYLCAGAGGPVAPGTVIIATTSDARYAKVVIDGCGETLKFRYTTYDRRVVTLKPDTGGLEAPVLKSPPEGTVFEHDPRDLLLAWGRVPGATSYTLELDCRGCCPPRKELFCSEQENGKVFQTIPGLVTPAYYTLWIGPLAGRWRVRAEKAESGPDGRTREKHGPWSPSMTFSFKY